MLSNIFLGIGGGHGVEFRQTFVDFGKFSYSLIIISGVKINRLQTARRSSIGQADWPN